MNGNLRQRRRRWQLLRVTSMRFECADVVLTTVRLVTTFICIYMAQHSFFLSTLFASFAAIVDTVATATATAAAAVVSVSMQLFSI